MSACKGYRWSWLLESVGNYIVITVHSREMHDAFEVALQEEERFKNKDKHFKSLKMT